MYACMYARMHVVNGCMYACMHGMYMYICTHSFSHLRGSCQQHSSCRSVVTWGRAESGGDSSSVQEQLKEALLRALGHQVLIFVQIES